MFDGPDQALANLGDLLVALLGGPDLDGRLVDANVARHLRHELRQLVDHQAGTAERLPCGLDGRVPLLADEEPHVILGGFAVEAVSVLAFLKALARLGEKLVLVFVAGRQRPLRLHPPIHAVAPPWRAGLGRAGWPRGSS